MPVDAKGKIRCSQYYEEAGAGKCRAKQNRAWQKCRIDNLCRYAGLGHSPEADNLRQQWVQHYKATEGGTKPVKDTA
jgi:hypothetical protein